MRKAHGALAALLTTGMLAVAAVPAAASQTLGESFTPDKPCSVSGVFYPLAGEATNKFRVQSPGILTSWTFKTAASAPQGFVFKVGHVTDALTVKTLAEDGEVLAANDATPHPVRIPVAAGDQIGFYQLGGGENCASDTAGTPGEYYFKGSNPAPSDTPESGYTDNPSGLAFPLSATVEPDADGDHYGDVSQDACPSNASIQTPCPPAPSTNTTSGASSTSSKKDTTKPTFGGLSFSSTVFAAAKSGASVAKAKVGTKVTFSVSEGSTVKFTVDRKTVGRKVGKKCKALTKANAKKKACTRWVKVPGSFSVRAGAGKNTFTFRGRVGGKSLRPGKYRLSGRATDSAKNTSLPKNKGFTIVL
jgi:hypothetical protein